MRSTWGRTQPGFVPAPASPHYRGRRAGTQPVPQPARGLSSPTPASGAADARAGRRARHRGRCGTDRRKIPGRDRRMGIGCARAGPGRARNPTATRSPARGATRRGDRPPRVACVDPDALDLAIGRWLVDQQPPQRPGVAAGRAAELGGHAVQGPSHDRPSCSRGHKPPIL
jgi:hypothetical protein